MIAFGSSNRLVYHPAPEGHPERPDRIRAIAAAMRAAHLIDSPNPFTAFRIDLGPMPQAGRKLLELPEPEPAEERWLTAVHTLEHVRRIKHACEIGGGVLDQGDTVVGPRSYEVAITAVGTALSCCDAVMDGRARRAFAAVRPPGHHAEPEQAMGFCLFNNIAIAGRYLQAAHRVERIAIVDFDVHHGNGTQAAFEDDDRVLFISLHQDPSTCYPGTGNPWETGNGRGDGFTLNIPFDPGSGDAEYLNAFDQVVVPRLDAFAPEFLLISAGFDAHHDDPLAQIELSEVCFGQMTQRLVAVAERHGGGRIVSLLEGGYNLRSLGRSVVRHLIAMQDSPGGA